MSFYLPDFDAENGDTLAVSELADHFDVEAKDGAGDTMNDLFVALLNMDELMGDDPVKYDGMENIVRALATLDEVRDTESEFSLEPVEDGGMKITLSQTKIPSEDDMDLNFFRR